MSGDDAPDTGDPLDGREHVRRKFGYGPDQGEPHYTPPPDDDPDPDGPDDTDDSDDE